MLLALVALILQELVPGILRGGPGSGIILISLPQAEYSEKGSALMDLLKSAAPKGGLESITQDEGEVVVRVGLLREPLYEHDFLKVESRVLVGDLSRQPPRAAT